MQLPPSAAGATMPAEHVSIAKPTPPHAAPPEVSDPAHGGDSDSGAPGAKDSDGGSAQTAKSLVNVKL